MALSGSVSTSKYDGRYYTVSWTASQDVAKNQSKISWTLKAVGGDDSWYAERTLNVVIGDTTVFSKTARVERKTGTIESGETVITHDNRSGDASFIVSIQAAVFYSTVNCTGSDSFELNTIPRESAFGTITGNTIGSSVTVNITRNHSSFTHQLWYRLGNSDWVDLGTGIGISKTFTINMDMCSQFPDETSGNMQLCLATFNGTTQIGSYVYENVTVYVPESVAPTVSFTVTDANGHLGTFGAYVQGKSQFNINVSASGRYGSTIKDYKIEADGKVYTSETVTSELISSSGTLSIKVTVTDSRGRSSDTTKNVTVLPYEVPKITNFKAERIDDTHIKITFSASVSSLNSKNSASYKLQYKKSSASSYTPVPLTNYTGKFTVTNGTHEFVTDAGSYDLILEVTDKFGPIPKSTIGPSAKRLFSFLKNNKGIAFGKIAELLDTVDFGFNTLFRLKNVFSSASFGQTIFKRSGSQKGAAVGFENSEGILGYIGMLGSEGNTVVKWGATEEEHWKMLDEENFNQYALPLTGGTLLGDFAITSPTAGLTDRMYGVNKVLWSGESFMDASDTVTLSEAISAQPNGIVLVWSWSIDGTAHNNNFVYTFIPKQHTIAHSGRGVNCASLSVDGNLWKYVYINNTTITGYSQNQANPSCGGVATNNENYVLRYVLGV